MGASKPSNSASPAEAGLPNAGRNSSGTSPLRPASLASWVVAPLRWVPYVASLHSCGTTSSTAVWNTTDSLPAVRGDAISVPAGTTAPPPGWSIMNRTTTLAHSGGRGSMPTSASSPKCSRSGIRLMR